MVWDFRASRISDVWLYSVENIRDMLRLTGEVNWHDGVMRAAMSFEVDDSGGLILNGGHGVMKFKCQ